MEEPGVPLGVVYWPLVRREGVVYWSRAPVGRGRNGAMFFDWGSTIFRWAFGFACWW